MKKDKNEIKHTAHSTYRCQYHIVFAPKFRRKEIYGKLRQDIGEILRKLSEQKKVEIIEAEACPDHIHMLVCIPPYLSVSQFMGYLKGKSSLMIYAVFSMDLLIRLYTGFSVKPCTTVVKNTIA